MSKAIAKQTPVVQAVEVASGGVPADVLAELDYTTVPVVKLDGEDFKVKNANWRITDPDEGFKCVFLTARTNLLYKCSDEKHAIPFVYSADGELTTSGEEVSDIIAMWKEDGCSYQVKEYAEPVVKMVGEGEPYDGQFAQLSISPTSVKPFKAFLNLTLKAVDHLEPWQAVVRVHRSAQKVGRQYPFHKWEFEKVGVVDEDGTPQLEGA